MNRENRLTVAEAARLMGVSEQYIREGLKRGFLHFGNAVKLSSVWTYYISPQLFYKDTGIDPQRAAE